MHVEVREYDPIWPEQFQILKSELQSALQNIPYISIEHVGSTSVPNLCAKAVIDIDIIIAPEHLDATIHAITADGKYVCVGDQGILDRWAIRPTAGRFNVSPRRNIYVCIEGCLAVRNHLAVRDLCRCDAEVRERYAEVKRELGARDWPAVLDYVKAKTEVLESMLTKAGFSEGELEQIADAQHAKPYVLVEV
ncbi:hypothetical protein LTR37_011452 [Vermiconidia calcicola]|uniref:Uncharacterized protein n=1 Tax=Vermiconidia calcicola TaxID=1690605 RepID=A0ACC3N240_9PEZI|nr:hypothetical protein LTR37_011452 [Vermiconidia calcicola]